MLPRGLFKEYARALTLLLRFADALAIFLAGWAAYYFRFDTIELASSYLTALFLGSLLALVVFPFMQIYSSGRGKTFLGHIISLLQTQIVWGILLMVIAFLTKTGPDFSRSWFILWFLFSWGSLVCFRVGVFMVLRLMRKRGWNERRVIVVGATELGKQLVEMVGEAIWTGFRIVAVLDDEAPKSIGDIPVSKIPTDLSVYIENVGQDIDEIWIALPLKAEDEVKKMMHQLRHLTISIRLVLDVFGLGLLKNSITQVDKFSMLNLNTSPMMGFNRFIKAFEDRILAFIILLLISPLLFLIAIGIKFDSKGPIFFKQKRHGWDGKIINVYKFRTMVVHQEEPNLITQATSNDHRVTRFGSFLRKTSLDELPQFINVLQGRMSIVGPRPHALQHNEFYKDAIHAYMQRHKVKPGITGWAQINGWRGETETLDKMQKRIEFDLYYIDNWSLWFDLQIIIMTFVGGFMNKNAY